MNLSPGLQEKLILLVTTAALSGFLVPYVLKRIEQQRTQRQKEGDAELKRQDRIISAQAEFLDRLTEMLWEWRYLAIRLTYYGSIQDGAAYEAARVAYGEKFWIVLNNIRVEISKSYRLVSPEVLKQLKHFYSEIVAHDLALQAICRETDPIQRWVSYMDMNHRLFSGVSESIDKLLEVVATDLRLRTDS